MASKEFGRRLLTQTLAELALGEPDRVYATIPLTTNVADGFHDVSFQEMERMVRVFSVWMKHLGPPSTFETLAYIGIGDLRSVGVFFAAVRMGYKVFLPSPRNTPAVNAALLEATECTKLVYCPEMKAVVDQVCKLRPLTTMATPSLEELENRTSSPGFDSIILNTPVTSVPFDSAINHPILVLHSSGSTGLPKPITMTNGSFAVLDNERFLPRVDGRINRDFSIWDLEGGGKFYTVFPYFHLAGFLSLVVNPVFTEASSPVLGPALAPPTAALMKEILTQQKVRALYIPPSMAEQLLAEPDGLDYFRNLDFLCYTGAPFSPSAGQKLVQVTDLVPLYGSTEAFQTPQLVPLKEDWAYMEWNPHFKHEMQLVDNAYELVLYTDSSTVKMSALNHNVPNTPEWRTRDLFKPHPSKPNLWQYYGRRDDILVLSSGEKFNPVPMELVIGSSPLLTGVLVLGNQPQASVVLEPKKVMDGLIDAVWPLIQKANAEAPAHAHITRSKVYTVPPATFVRAGKGTIVRKLSEKALEHSLGPPESHPMDVEIHDIVTDIFGPVSIDEDLFARGLDSVKATEIARSISRVTASNVSLDWVYRNASIRQLAQANPGAPPFHEEVKAMIAKYSQAPLISTSANPPTTSIQSTTGSKTIVPTKTIAITGTTGALGSALLDRLTEWRVYGLNRRRDTTHEAKYPTVRFFQVQLDQPQLGLDEYGELLENVDIILHNAWPVDFSLPLPAFERQIQGVRNLILWSLESPRRPRIAFCSSVSAVMDWPSASKQAIPEAFVTGPLATGYAGSKYVAEQLLASTEVDTTIFRLGQLVSGDMSRSWIPPLLQTAETLGFPVNLCDIDWLTVDEASTVMLELLKGSGPKHSVYNLVNPTPCTWEYALPLLYPHPPPPLPLTAWLDKLDTGPALPSSTLLAFFRALGAGKRGLRYETQHAAESAHFRAIQPVATKIAKWHLRAGS